MASGQDKIGKIFNEDDCSQEVDGELEIIDDCPLATDQNPRDISSLWEVTPPFSMDDDSRSDLSNVSTEDEGDSRYEKDERKMENGELTSDVRDLLNVTMLETLEGDSNMGHTTVKQESLLSSNNTVVDDDEKNGVVEQSIDIKPVVVALQAVEVPRSRSEYPGTSERMSENGEVVVEANGAVNGEGEVVAGAESNAESENRAAMALTPEDKHFIFTVLPTIRPTEIDLEAKNIVAELERFTCDFDEQLEAAIEPGILNKLPPAQKTAAWKVALGSAARDLIRTFEWAQGEDKNCITTIRQKLVEAVSTPATRRMAMEKFWEARQEANEPVKDFIGRLEVLSAQAQWNKATPDDFMAVRLGNGLRGRDLRTWVRAQPQETTLAEIKKHVIAAEALEKEDQAYQAMKDDRGQGKQHQAFANKDASGSGESKSGNDGRRKAEKINCGYCGTMHFRGKNPMTGRYNCPASGHVCRNCNYSNHYEWVCIREPNPYRGKVPGSNEKKVSYGDGREAVGKTELNLGKNDGNERILTNMELNLQRSSNDGTTEKKNKKKAKRARKEKARAVSESSSSESSSDSEEERKKNKKDKKKAARKEKTRAAKHKHSSTEDDTSDSAPNPADFVVNLSSSSATSSSSQPEAAAEVKMAFGKAGGSGLQWSAKSKPRAVTEPMKSATMMPEFRIPKQKGKKTPVERKAAQLQAKSQPTAMVRGHPKSVSRNEQQKKPEAVQNIEKVPKKKKRSWSENVTINGRALKMKVDSGSTVTILTWRDFCRLGISEDALEPTRSTIVTYSGNQILPLGKMKVTVSLRGKRVQAKILVIKEASTSLLGFPEGLGLGLFRVDVEFMAKKIQEEVNECLSGKDRSEHDEVP